MKVKFAKIRTDAKMPHRAHPTDAGADIFAYIDRKELLACDYDINEAKLVYFNDMTIWVMPQETVLIPTGLKAEIPEGYALEVKNRGSVPFKKSLIVGSCLCDPLYQGELFMNIHNVGKESISIVHGEKLLQLVMYPVICFESVEATEEELYEGEQTQRGEGALGSTNGNA